MLVFSANLFRLFVCHMCRGEHQFRKIMCKQLDYPNVSCDVSYQYDTTRHMRLVNDTTLHNTKRHKKLELMKNLKKKIIKKVELPGLKLTTVEVFHSDAHVVLCQLDSLIM